MKNEYLFKLIFCFLLVFQFFSQSQAEDCESATAQIDLDINNVRARLQIGGDLWWDGNNGRYIVPKPGFGEPEVSGSIT